MKNHISMHKVETPESLLYLQNDWLKTLTGPQDGMWEAFRSFSQHWSISSNRQLIGYACTNSEGQLIQFYLSPEWQARGTEILAEFLQENGAKEAIIGTNNPVFLSPVLRLQKSMEVHTLLFTDSLEAPATKAPGKLRPSWNKDLENLVEFCHQSTGAPTDWLRGYYSNLIERRELFMLEEAGEILGTCEVRKSDSNPLVSDVGMVVSPNHRRKGLGTFLLAKAKEMAHDDGRKPICSCEHDNIGSLKAIQAVGFRSLHQLIRAKF